MTGAELKALRRQAGINQTAMAQLIGCSRHAISYWECKPVITTRQVRWGVPARMCDVLGMALPNKWPTTRTRGDGVLQGGQFSYAIKDPQQDALDRECDRINGKVAARAARYRQPCGAKTRKGHPCRNMSEAGKRRCKFHGGLSTGPKTPEGKARIAAAQRKRWVIFASHKAGTVRSKQGREDSEDSRK